MTTQLPKTLKRLIARDERIRVIEINDPNDVPSYKYYIALKEGYHFDSYNSKGRSFTNVTDLVDAVRNDVATGEPKL